MVSILRTEYGSFLTLLQALRIANQLVDCGRWQRRANAKRFQCGTKLAFENFVLVDGHSSVPPVGRRPSVTVADAVGQEDFSRTILV
jgi:hypothetical protein